MILLLLFLACVALVFYVFPDWPLVAVLLAPLSLLLLGWLANQGLQRVKSAVRRKP